MSTAIASVLEVKLDDDDRLYELIKGQRAEKPVGASEIRLANHLAFAINSRAIPNQSGMAIVEVLLDIGHPEGDQFRPDMIYVSNERWPMARDIPPGNAWSLVPELAVEIISPSNKYDEIHDKIETYLAAGVRQVWVIVPRSPCLYIHDGSAIVRMIGVGAAIEGGDLLPGFHLPFANLFPNRVAANP